MTELSEVERDRQARIDVIKTYWEALMSGDMVTFRSLLAPGAVIHYPGQNYLSGDYTTTDSIVELTASSPSSSRTGCSSGRCSTSRWASATRRWSSSTTCTCR